MIDDPNIYDDDGNPLDADPEDSQHSQDIDDPNAIDLSPKDKQPRHDPLPDGFDPKKHGLYTADDYQQLQENLAKAEKRAEDNQRAFHDDRSRFSQELAEVRTRLDSFALQPPQHMQQPLQHSSTYLNQYRQSNGQDWQAWQRYEDAKFRENLQSAGIDPQSLNKVTQGQPDV
jgi:hypothetical protein